MEASRQERGHRRSFCTIETVQLLRNTQLYFVSISNWARAIRSQTRTVRFYFCDGFKHNGIKTKLYVYEIFVPFFSLIDIIFNC